MVWLLPPYAEWFGFVYGSVLFVVWLLPPHAGWFCLVTPATCGMVILSSLFSWFRLVRDGLVFWDVKFFSGDVA